jgi:hypothetical protein
MFHFLDPIEKRFYEREELAEAGLLAKTLLVSFDRIPFDRQNPVFRLFVSAQQAVSETMLRGLPNRLGLLISLFKRRSVPVLNSVADDFRSHSFNPFASAHSTHHLDTQLNDFIGSFHLFRLFDPAADSLSISGG